MAIYKRPDASCWWYAIYRKGKPLLRGSAGTEDRAEALAVERILKDAHSDTNASEKKSVRFWNLFLADGLKRVCRLPASGRFTRIGLKALNVSSLTLRSGSEGACVPVLSIGLQKTILR